MWYQRGLQLTALREKKETNISSSFIDLLKPTVPAFTGALSGPDEEAVLTIDMVYVSPFTRPVRVCVSVEPSLTVSLPLSLSLV